MGKQDDSGSGLLGMVMVAGLIGAGVALLTAPKSGKETRADLRRKMHDAKAHARERRQEMSDTAHDLATRVSDEVDHITRRAGDVADQSKEAVKEARERVEDAARRADDASRSSRR